MALPHMKNLKFRQLDLSETSICAFVALCPVLVRLDVSFTRLHRLPTVTPADALEKLSLTSTALSTADVASLISALPKLRTLYLGALGSGQGSGAMTLTDDTLTPLTNAMDNLEHLEKFSLVGNTRLGLTSRHDEHGALTDVIRRVGRKCKARPTYLACHRSNVPTDSFALLAPQLVRNAVLAITRLVRADAGDSPRRSTQT